MYWWIWWLFWVQEKGRIKFECASNPRMTSVSRWNLTRAEVTLRAEVEEERGLLVGGRVERLIQFPKPFVTSCSVSSFLTMFNLLFFDSIIHSIHSLSLYFTDILFFCFLSPSHSFSLSIHSWYFHSWVNLVQETTLHCVSFLLLHDIVSFLFPNRFDSGWFFLISFSYVCKNIARQDKAGRRKSTLA